MFVLPQVAPMLMSIWLVWGALRDLQEFGSIPCAVAREKGGNGSTPPWK